MNNNYDDKIIKNMMEQIHTPKYNVSKDVIKKISAVPKSKYFLRKVLIAAIIICLCAGLLGALKLIVVNVVNLDGETSQFEYPPNPAVITPTPEFEIEPIDIYNGFFDDITIGELRLIIDKNDYSAQMNIPDFDTSSYSELEEALKLSIIDFSLPYYIPDGYTFTKGSISYFLGEETLEAELLLSEEKNNNIYEVYRLPERYKKYPNNVFLYFNNEQGDEIRYSIFLTYSEEEGGSIQRNITKTITTKTLEIQGFEKSLLLHNSAKNAYFLNELVLYNEISPVKEITNFIRVFPKELPEEFKSEEIHYLTYSGVLYLINTDSLTEVEVIKIAKSIK